MKKLVTRLSVAVIAMILLLSSLTGCLSFDLALRPTRTVSAEELVNNASLYSTRSVMMLNVTYKTGMLDIGKSYIGSAVIFKNETVYYYTLTCAHCVDLGDGRINHTIEAMDAFGNVYDAQLYAIDAELDLACICFRVSDTSIDLRAVDLAERVSDVGETVICIGSPHGQPHVVTIGEVLGYTETTLTDFRVITHSALIGGGSSGGALLNSELELIGINFAGNDDQEYSNGYAIPIDRVREFLTQNGLI